MSQSSQEKYVYFTVGLLKDSMALEAFRKDALKHHMVDQPGQLMALRITEYYEMMNQGIVQPVIRMPAIMLSPEPEEQALQAPSALPATGLPASSPSVLSQLAHPLPGRSSHSLHAPHPSPPPSSTHSAARQPSQNAAEQPMGGQMTGRMAAIRQGENVVSTSPHVDQNADEAADYWSLL